MDIMQILHMNTGEGDTSYAKNCTIQKRIISMENTILEDAVADCMRGPLPRSMGIADLGCSSGPNTLMVVSNVIDTIVRTARAAGSCPLPELRVSLNDLPGNDFNSIFKSLPEFYKRLDEEKGVGPGGCLVSCVAGSFYGRLFPRESLHFVHSSSSLHWLSRVPPALDVEEADLQLNKGKIYISKTSPSCVVKAYASQFHEDFSVFLRSRAEEMVSGGRMVLSFMGRDSSEATVEVGSHQWALFGQALMSMALEGLVEEEKIDMFNVPYYAPCAEEVRNVIEEEGFNVLINRLEAFEVDWVDEGSNNDTCEMLSRGQKVAISHRAVVESMVEARFGNEVMDELFRRYGELVDEYFSNKNKRPKHINLVISLTKI